MAVLYSRNPQGHSFSTIQEHSKSGWSYCMSKAYCKWPVIAGIVIAVLFFLLTIFCCLRCCGCLGGRRKKTKQSFIPAPYQGYQPANAHAAPPPYGHQPPQFAQFDANRKVGEDSLPAMPSWTDARETRIEDPNHKNDMELGHLQKPAMASTAALPQSPQPQYTGVTDNRSQPALHDQPTGYTGPDFGVGAGHSHAQPHQPYTGPDFSTPSPANLHSQDTGYSAYARSESTRYGPSHANDPQELGTTYDHVPVSPGPPTALQAGKPPGQHWRDV